MAPRKGKETPLELCTLALSEGNTIAVHLLEYFDATRDPPHGLTRLSTDFLELNRCLIASKDGLQRAHNARTHFTPDITKQLTDQFRQSIDALALLNKTVSRLLEAEKKHGFGKLGRSVRLLFADGEIAKSDTAINACRQQLTLNTLVHGWSLGVAPHRPTDYIGYTALAAVLGHVDPSIISSSASVGEHSATAADVSEVKPSHVQSTITDVTDLSAFRDSVMLARSGSALETSSPVLQKSTISLSSSQQEGKRRNSNTLSSLRSVEPLWTEESVRSVVDSHHKEMLVSRSVIPSEALKRTPKFTATTVSTASMSALVNSVHQKNYKAVEQLLDSGVPANQKSGLSLLGPAIINRDLETVSLLLSFGADPNARDDQNRTPLFSATEACFFAAAEVLIQYGADPNVCSGPDRESPLALAFSAGRPQFAQLFLDYGGDPSVRMESGDAAFLKAMNTVVPLPLVSRLLTKVPDLNQKSSHGETALFRAISAQRLDIVKMLVEGGADVNLPGPKHMLWPAVHCPPILELILDNGATLAKAPGVLELATSMNSLEAVNILLRHGVDINAKKDGIFTPLCTAIRDDHVALVDILLAAGADPNCQASEFPAFKCVTHHRAHLLPRVLAAGANPSKPPGIIEAAVAHKNNDALLVLLQHKVDPNARNPKGHTALTTAIRMERLDVIDVLLAHGADPAIRGQDWPLHMAVAHPAILAKLLPHVPITKVNKGILELAVKANQLECVKMLIEKGVSVEERTGGVFSPLTTSIREDRREIFRYLLDHAGADPNAPGEHLPIIKAIRRHREDDLSYITHLLDKGADINLMYRGWNAVLQALDNGDKKILRLLAERGSPDLTVQDESGQTIVEIIHDRGLEEEGNILLQARRPTNDINDAMGQLRNMILQELNP